MTDPYSPVPDVPAAADAEPAPRRRRLKKKWVISVVAVAMLLGGAGYAGHAKGNSNAEKYEKALDDWRDQRNDLVGAPSEANSGLWEFYEDPTTKKSLSEQRRACSRVMTLRKSASQAAAAVPTAPDSMFKLFSPGERKATKDSAARKKAVKAYAKAVDKIMVQMRRDCAWNIKINATKESDSGAKKLFDKAEGLLLKPGRSAGNYYCPSSSKVSCLPATLGGRTQYAELIIKALKVDRKYVIKTFYSTGSCDSTSYAELCKELKADLVSYYGNIEDYNEVFKLVNPSNTELKEEHEKMKKGNKSADKAFKKALFEARPEFKDDFRVSKYPFWREAYFSASTVESIVSLEKLRKAVLHLNESDDTMDALGPLNR